MIRRRLPPRFFLRLFFFVAAVLLLLNFPFRFNTSGIIVQASPFITICSLLAGGIFGIGSILGVFFSAAALVRKRWFCRNICPVGFLLDCGSEIGMKKRSWWIRIPSIGRYIVIMTAAGAVFGYPLFLWLDPLSVLSNSLSVYNAEDAMSAVTQTAGIAILLLIAITSADLWCLRICPLGATQDILADIKKFFKKTAKTFKTESQEKTPLKKAFPATRRVFLAIAAGMGLGLWAKKINPVRAEEGPLRPPGAVSDDMFAGQCARCGGCMRVCPSKIIHPDMGEAGFTGFMAPIVRYRDKYCVENCNACVQICPSGALKNLNLEQKNEYVIGLAMLSAPHCLLVTGVSDCNICMRVCPFDAIQMYWDDEAYVAYPHVDMIKCNGCGACEVYCPTGDIKAIKVMKFNGQ